MNDTPSRRGFLRNAAAVASAPAFLQAQGTANKLRMAWIGTGGRGYYLMQRHYEGSKDLGEVTHVCDAFTERMARAKDLVQSTEKKTPKAVADYREILRDPSVDAVVIATPEHLHYQMFMDAITICPTRA